MNAQNDNSDNVQYHNVDITVQTPKGWDESDIEELMLTLEDSYSDRVSVEMISKIKEVE